MIETIYIENQIKKHHRTKQILSKFKKKIDIIIHCAATHSFSKKKIQEFKL